MNTEEIKKQIEGDLKSLSKNQELLDIKSKYLGKEGVITLLQSKIKEIPNEDKKEYGIKVNEVRTYFNTLFEEVKTSKIKTSKIKKSIKIMFKWVKFVLFIIMLTLTFAISEKLANLIINTDINKLKQIINVIIAVVVVIIYFSSEKREM